MDLREMERQNAAIGAMQNNLSLNDDELMLKKLKLVKEAIKKAQNLLRAYLKPGSELDIVSKSTVSTSGESFSMSAQVNISEDGVSKSINFPINISYSDAVRLPMPELYAKVSALGYGSLSNAKVIDKSKINQNDNKVEFDKEVKEIAVKNKQEIDSEELLAAYFESYLHNVARSNDFVDKGAVSYSEIAHILAESAVHELGVNDSIDLMFDVDALKSAVDEDSLHSARNIKLIGKAKEALNESAHEPRVALGYLEQSNALLSERTKSAFEKIKSVSGTSLKTNYNTEGACRAFIVEYLQPYGIPASALNLTFNPLPSNEIGMFYKNQNRLNIDLNNVRSATDLVMTLSHELRHFVDESDCIREKADFGWNDLDNYVDEKKQGDSDFELDKNAVRLFRKLNSMCYHLDPDERAGREGELVGLKFMQEIADGDYNLKVDIERNIEAFEDYQEKTCDMINGLFDEKSAYNLELLSAEIERANVPEDVKEMMRKRLKYLDALSNNMDSAKESQSIKEAHKIARQLKGYEVSEGPQPGE